MLDICFVHFDTYPVLKGGVGGYVGGESVQHSLLAKSFAARNHKVSAVVTDFGQPDGEAVAGVRCYKTCSRSAGVPVLRFVHPRMSSLWKALERSEADIYYWSCAEYVTGLLAAFCAKHRKRFVLRVAHDADCIPGKQLIRLWRDRKLYEYGLRRADMVFVQTAKQQQLLARHYGVSSTVVNMVVEEPAEDLNGVRDIDVLWVNNMRPFKRPEVLLEVAALCPDVHFTMIGGPVPGLESYYQTIMKRAQSLPNLTALGPVSYAEVNGFFARSKIFVNTSGSEGFPNSFLQAWIRAVPVVSFFDPDGLIDSRVLGIRVSSVEQMGRALSALLNDAVRYAEMAAAVRRHALANYAASSVVSRYETLLQRMQ